MSNRYEGIRRTASDFQCGTIVDLFKLVGAAPADAVEPYGHYRAVAEYFDCILRRRKSVFGGENERRVLRYIEKIASSAEFVGPFWLDKLRKPMESLGETG